MFRSASEAILVDVSVRKGRKPVRGLGVEDFELRDNGVIQKIETVSNDELPIDLTLVIDISASVVGDTRTRLLSSVREIAGRLRASDTLELLLTDDRLEFVQSTEFYRRVAERPAQRLGDGGTVLYDGLAVALMKPPQPGRRHLIIALTDGTDTSSVISDTALRQTVSKSEAVLYLVAISDMSRAWGFLRIANAVFPTTYDSTMSELIAESGGRVLAFVPGQPFVVACGEIIEELRGRYTLSYVPTSVATDGWHSLAVKVPKGGYEVLSRRGYYKR
jgi:VWFA-related protein